jgi:site-specific DNA-methyltransferase (adenine-specific)|tara:strand:- start:1693 stop:2340 length:648 start_codon:yes stop_codon:yes gene_type:complete
MKEYNHKNLKLINADCMDIMKEYKDNYFDLAIVDPPYGIKIQQSGGTPSHLGFKNYKKKNWDNEIPSKEYFTELFRVSKNQIIWGANYFVKYLNKGTMGWVFWFKGQNGLSMSDGEIAYTSFQKATRQVKINRCDIKLDGAIHPTQKPIRLYNFLLDNYSNKNDKILDTHLGSGSSAIASFYYACKEFVGIEIDTEYYNDSIKRIKQKTAQMKLL